MTINTMAYMFFVAIFGLFKLRVKSDRILSWLMFGIMLFIFGEYYAQSITGGIAGFSVLWAKSQIGDITIGFAPAPMANLIIIPLFLLSLTILLNNNIFRYEERRCPYNSFIIFNFMSLSLLLCAENYVQLITMVFLTDILGYLILKDVDSSRRYVISNFFADMCLFTILALACGKIHSLDMSRLLGYEQIGRHKDFVSLVTALALFIKMGCFPFQSYLTDISPSRFQRMSAVSLFFPPLTGIILLLKLHNLLFVSDLFIPFFQIITLLTFIIGACGFVVKRNMQKKTIYLNVAFIGMLLQLLRANDFNWNMQLSFYYMGVYLFNQILFKIYLYQNRETDITKMLNASEINTAALKILLIQSSLLNALFLVLIQNMTNIKENWLIFGEAFILFVTQAIVLSHIYKSPLSRRLDYLNVNSVRVLSFIVNSLLILCGLYIFRTSDVYLLAFLILFLVLIASPIGKPFRLFYDKKELQSQDFSGNFFFYVLVLPLTYLSRTIWLMLDRFLSEKIISAFASTMEKNSILLFLKINKKSYGANILFIIIGIMIFILSYYGSLR